MDTLTATELSLRIDKRRARAGQMASTIMQVIDPFLREDGSSVRRSAFERLYELFFTEGVEVLTDHDRAMLGLPQRDGEGWSDEELKVLDYLRLQIMLKPLVMPLNPSSSEAGKGTER